METIIAASTALHDWANIFSIGDERHDYTVLLTAKRMYSKLFPERNTQFVLMDTILRLFVHDAAHGQVRTSPPTPSYFFVHLFVHGTCPRVGIGLYALIISRGVLMSNTAVGIPRLRLVFGISTVKNSEFPLAIPMHGSVQQIIAG